VSEQIVSQDELNRIAQEAMAGPEVVVTTEAPPSPLVELPGGFVTLDGELITTVEVKELTGEDEEIVAKSSSGAKALHTLLVRGTVSIGDMEPEKEDFDKLLAGDRDSILIGIRCATFGAEVAYRATCSACNTQQEFDIDLNEDLEYKKLEDPVNDRTWNVTLKNGDIASVSLPTGKTQRKLMDAPDSMTGAELSTMLLTGCINSVNGSPARPNTALKLGLKDREKIMSEISERNPGPRLAEVSKACEACGEKISTPLSLGALFRF
jgi:hypothetical protein